MRPIHAIVVVAVLSALSGCGGRASNPDHHTVPADLARIAGWKGADVNAPDTFRFVVMSDRTGGHVPGVWAQAVRDVNRLRPDFVMCIGDLVEGFEKTRAGAEAEWNEMDALIRKLDAPFFYCAGNHDVPNAIYRDAYVRRGRKIWYSFNYRGCHFVVFDSTAMEREIPGISEPQWRWLQKDLAAAAGARHIFIFFHHPIYGDRGDWMRFRKFLHKGKTTIFSGHTHSLSFGVEHQIPFLTLGATGGFGGTGDPQRGGSHQFAHVTVCDGQPRICVLPLGYVLPHDLRTRDVAPRRRAVAWGAEFTEITRRGGRTTLTVHNAADVRADYTLTWTGPAEWFGGRIPKPVKLTLAPDQAVRRSWRLAAASSPTVAPPAMNLYYAFTSAGKPVKGVQRVGVFARAVMRAGRVGKIAVDGRLDDWAAVPCRAMGARWQIGDNPKQWTGPADCSAAVRVGYDDANLYVAMDVTDDALIADGQASWQRDGVEVFIDPRPPPARTIGFGGPCRQVSVPLPEAGKPTVPEVGPADAAPALKVRAACRRRPGGYVVEIAVSLASIGGARIAGGAAVRMDFAVNDKDMTDKEFLRGNPVARGVRGPRTAPVAYLVQSAYRKPNHRTAAYAEVRFK